VKGAIAVGNHADLIAFDDAATFTVTRERVHHRHKITPYAGETLHGVVQATYLRGTKVAEGGKTIATERGQLL
jgi:allantoinase